MRARAGIDELPRDADLVSGLAHAALEDVADPQFAPDLLHVYGPALVGKAGIAGDHEQAVKARQGRDDLLDHPVGEIFLLSVAAHVLERQDGDRRLVGKRQRNCLSGWCSFPGPAPNTDRLCDVLQRPLTGIFEGEVGLASKLLLHSIGNANTPRLRPSLEPRGDVDAIPEQVVAFDDNVTDIYADAKHDAVLGRDVLLMSSHPLLHGDGTRHSIDNGDKFHDCAIAHQLDDTASVLCDQRVYDLRAKGLDRAERTRLIHFD